MEIELLKYPVGKFNPPQKYTNADIKKWIGDIASFPDQLKAEVSPLSTDQLEWKYRPGGWCIRQVVHHCADSHINSVMRFKLALTEDKPQIKPYEEALWAELADMTSPVGWSLQLLDALHKRWVVLLECLNSTELEKTFLHPGHGTSFTLAETIANYSWHCRHHLAHVQQAITSKGTY